jgi:hypothetical protein
VNALERTHWLDKDDGEVLAETEIRRLPLGERFSFKYDFEANKIYEIIIGAYAEGQDEQRRVTAPTG